MTSTRRPAARAASDPAGYFAYLAHSRGDQLRKSQSITQALNSRSCSEMQFNILLTYRTTRTTSHCWCQGCLSICFTRTPKTIVSLNRKPCSDNQNAHCMSPFCFLIFSARQDRYNRDRQRKRAPPVESENADPCVQSADLSVAPKRSPYDYVQRIARNAIVSYGLCRHRSDERVVVDHFSRVPTPWLQGAPS